MDHEPAESGFDELMRLSRQFTRQEHEDTRREQQRAEQKKKVQDVLGGLKDLRLTMAVEQLRLVASPEIVEKVESLKNKQGNEELRRLISDLADELEGTISTLSAANEELKPLESSIRALVILMELYFAS